MFVAMVGNSDLPASMDFGRFRVLPRRRELLVDGQPAKLGGRAFDVLMALIEARGAVVTKNVLMAQVWPDRVVEENNLQIQVSVLRAVLGADRDLIRTVSGRGYQFSGNIQVVPADSDQPIDAVAAQRVAVLPPTNAPMPVSELIGRDTDLEEVSRIARAHPLVTLTGIGGIGKTMLALALACELRPHFADGVWLAEFSAVSDPGLVPATIAAAVGLELGGGEVSAQRVAQALADRRLLLVLDTCEHVIAAAATVAHAMLRVSSVSHIIATSREPLRAGGERVYPVQPLAVPAENVASVDDLLQYGAVRLFIDRVAAADPHFVPDPRSVTMIAAICRSLDGIPLAIELAAARVPALGVQALATRIDDRFRLLTGGRRTALPRHQALRTTFDWSHDLLAESERMLLRRLAVFAGAFSLAAAVAVAASPDLSEPDVIDALVGLVEKSLVLRETPGTVERYRLLDTTRAYALEKLQQSGEREWLVHHHAEYYRDLFEQAEVEWETRPAQEWLHDYRWCIDNLRTALDWAFSPEGAASIGVALTAAAVPLWMHLSLLDECRGRAEQALAACKTADGGDPRREMKLYTAVATSSFWGSASVHAQFVVRGQDALWTKALEIAESLDAAEYQLRALWGLFGFRLGTGEFHVALEMAQRFRTLAAQQQRQNDELVGERLVGTMQHLRGDQVSARRHIEHMLANFVQSDQRAHELIRFQVDHRGAARLLLARILWFQGSPDEAVRTVKGVVHDAIELNHAVSLCYALDFAACPIMLWVGDLTSAEQYIAMLADYSKRYALPLWSTLSRAFQALLLIRRGDFGSGLELSRVDWDNFGARPGWFALFFLNELAAGFAGAGQIAEGLAAAEQAIARAERTGIHWAIPESLRIKGELLLSQGATGAEIAAEDHFRQALDWARRQGALSLELRAATSLARLRNDQGGPAEAASLLQPVYDRFSEGFDTADLKDAKALLDALAALSA
jgi:predicted ATPase/DNA-binding winged helix-turn-helix (wHTH) protein